MEHTSNLNLQLLYREKYFALKRRCEEIQQANDKLVNRIYNVKNIIKRYKTERSVLMQRLDSLGDDYEDALVPAFWEEGTSNGAADETKMAEQHLSAVMKRESDVNGLEPPQSASSAADVAHHAVQVARQSKEKRSAFMLFCSLQRNSVQEKFIETHGEEPCKRDLSKLLSEEWKQLSLEEKQVFVSLAAAKRKKPRKTESRPAAPVAPPAQSKPHVGVAMDYDDVMGIEVNSEQQ